MYRLSQLISLFLALTSTAMTFASTLSQRSDVAHFIDKMVKEHQFNRQELTQTMNQVVLQPQVIESMNKPFEQKTWDVYKQLFLTSERIQGGIDFWKANTIALARAERQYGVPAHIIVAIIGVETLYGKRQGNYRVLDALTTLAFNYPKRSAFFMKELTEYLILCHEHHVPATYYTGSYAGAIGKPQFMPSSYRYYAANFSGQAKKDLVHDDNAVIASVANYFQKNGWRSNQAIAQPAIVQGYRYKRINTAIKKATYPLQQLNALGVKPLSRTFNEKAGLLDLTTRNGHEFWIAYSNFYVITRYNTSPQYALAVYLLSQQLQRKWAALSRKPFYA